MIIDADSDRKHRPHTMDNSLSTGLKRQLVAAIIVMKMRNLMLHPWAIWARIHTRATNISSRLAIASLTTRAQAAISRAKTAAHSSIATPWRGGAATSAISPRAE
jgi:hypothetical protein